MARAVLSQADISRALTRISHEILESNRGSYDLVILGIPTRGVVLARRIAENIARIEPDAPAALAGALDVTMYRDDLGHTRTRTPAPTDVPPGGIDGKTVVLVDDVLYSGRTIRAAFDALERPRPGARRAPRRARRPGPPRVPDPGRLRGQEPAEFGASSASTCGSSRSTATTP